MQLHGLCRVPYYPELNCLNADLADKTALILSILLYWHSKVPHQRFNARAHVRQLARNLRMDEDIIRSCLRKLVDLKILDYTAVNFKTNSDNPLKQQKTDEFYDLNFHNLHEVLKEHGLNIPVKVLHLAADDSFDHMAYISPERLPTLQGLYGMVKGEAYDETALNIAFILCGICKDETYEAFSYKALAPGWRMLVQADADPYLVAERWMREGERSIDVDLGDGSFFLPDGNYFGTEKHYIWHTKKNREPKILAAALYLVATAKTSEAQFFSDLSLEELRESFTLLHRFTELLGKIEEPYYYNLDLQGENKTKAIALYQEIINQVKTEKSCLYYNK
jgi:hypothetical protein